MGEIPTQHLEVMAESFRHDGLNWHHVVIRATLDGIADLRAALRAAEKAREEADAYAGRANARIADLGERLDATEAVLRDAEKARKEAEERLTLKRREYAIEVKVHAATKRERDSYIKGYEAAESRAARLAKAGAEFASQYGARAFDCRYDNSCDDSGREPRCAPCELRAAIAAEEGK